MKKIKRKVILLIKVLGVLVLISIILLFAFRNTLLNKVIRRVDNQMERDYQCNFSIKKAEFYGLTNVELQNITLVPKKADTLLHIKELKTSVNFWKLLVGDIQLGKLEINQGFIQLVKDKTCIFNNNIFTCDFWIIHK